jgi:hypothetical protein
MEGMGSIMKRDFKVVLGNLVRVERTQGKEKAVCIGRTK